MPDWKDLSRDLGMIWKSAEMGYSMCHRKTTRIVISHNNDWVNVMIQSVFLVTYITILN